MDVYEQIAVRIIKGQEAIIGPVAIEQAKRVDGLSLDWDQHEISIADNKVIVLDELIQIYKELFGHISVEVSKQAAGSLMDQLPAGGLPESLK